MSKKEKRGRGRPKSGNPPRTNRVQVLLNDTELEAITTAANGNASAFLRDAGLKEAACS